MFIVQYETNRTSTKKATYTNDVPVFSLCRFRERNDIVVLGFQRLGRNAPDLLDAVVFEIFGLYLAPLVIDPNLLFCLSGNHREVVRRTANFISHPRCCSCG